MDTTRFCQKCENEVEDTGGFCLLGHRLTLDAPTASLDELRAEVDRSFEEARLEIEALVSSGSGGSPSPTPIAAPVGPASPSTVPVAPVRRMPPPPPPPPARKASYGQVWKELEKDIDLTNDPINAFAPAPRLDWGPEKTKRLRRKSQRPSRRDGEN
ncbi:MAG: hypothetical protein M3285_09865 [Actinomycetota bacterium]|nr:hypothetical protein [Actinomycetota bacterium]